MTKAFVLINTAPGKEKGTLDQLLKCGSIVSFVHIVYGLYDLIAVVEASSLEEVKKCIAHQIRDMAQVVTTLTLLTA